VSEPIRRTEETMRKNDLFDNAFCRTGDRVFRQGTQWYFRTRANHRGPFETQTAALQELGRYIDTMEFIEDNELPPDVDSSHELRNCS
jgi:hypothetical protein